MSADFERSKLFQDSFFGPFAKGHEESIQTLLASLRGMRENVQALLANIPAECRGLTIHDVSHLDALWDVASLLVGDRICLNPAEGFVLGAAILTHDAGLTAASYPGGLKQLEQTATYKDYSALIVEKLRDASDLERSEQALFAALRRLHAEMSRDLVTRAWKLPANQTDLYLLEQETLRSAYGRSIGDVAASHHWSVERLPELRNAVGAPPTLPSSWSIDERKLAAILRVADVANVDRRRAPSMHYAVQQPIGYSDLHWRFQNKLSKPTVDGDLLVFSSGSDFDLADAESWWLAFETMQVIDREIGATNRMLSRLGLPELSVKGVLGAKDIKVFQGQVGTRNWTPIDASIKVSDPRQLASAIGGSQLYGDGGLAPVREILQNSVDAIRARRALEARPSNWGEIKVSIHRLASGQIRVSIADNGVGMSEEVLCGPLIDFGKSFWSSELVVDLFPGLASKRVKFIGKYGIGFFSLFGVADDIEVVSRRYDSSLTETKSLKFSGLRSRPILSDAKGRLPADVSTIVTFEFVPTARAVPQPRASNPALQGILDAMDDEGESEQKDERFDPIEDLATGIRDLVVPLDVKVVIEAANLEYSHERALVDEPRDVIVSTLAQRDSRGGNVDRSIAASLLAPVLGADGESVGLASLDIERCVGREPFNGYQPYLVLSVGGFASEVGGRTDVPEYDLYYASRGSTVDFLPPMIGIVEGVHNDVSRRTGTPIVTRADAQRWLDGQVEMLLGLAAPPRVLAKAAFTLLQHGYDPGRLPFSFEQGRYVSFDDWKRSVAKRRRFETIVSADKEEGLKLPPVGDLIDDMREGLQTYEGLSLLSPGANREIYRSNPKYEESKAVERSLRKGVLSGIARTLEKTWGVADLEYKLERKGIYEGVVSLTELSPQVLILEPKVASP